MTSSSARLALSDLVPHRPPMLLLDELISYDAGGATCKLTLTRESPFVRNGRAPAIVAMEYLAQAVAAFATLHPQPGVYAEASGNGRGKPRIGYLVGVRGLQLRVEHFEVGDELLVTVKHVWGSGEGAQFAGNVDRHGETLVTGTLTVYVPPEKDVSA